MLIKSIKSADTLTLRQQILLPNSDISACIFEADDAPNSHHFAVFQGGLIVGVVSLMQASQPNVNEQCGYQLRAMAVITSQRGKGLGLQLLAAAEQQARACHADYIWANAKTDAIGFYQKAGYHVDSTVFDIAPVGPHQKISKQIVY